jgi:NitT/TauT family transport system substrate-binding protein
MHGRSGARVAPSAFVALRAGGRALVALAALVAVASGALAAEKAVDRPSYTVGVSIWTGWMPFYLMDARGILARRADEEGVSIKVEKFKDYLASVQAFAAGKLDGCAVTIMDALQPASSGLDVRAILVNDFSAGGDGVIARKGLSFKDMKGKEVLLEQGSVSHYLLIKALEANGMTEGQVVIKNIGGDDAGKAFIAGQCDFAVTWNPHLFMAEEAGKGQVLFTSKSIPGEIIDLLVWNGKKMDADKRPARAIVNAWYDVMALLKDPKKRADAIAFMAKEAGTSPEDFNKLLEGTDLFTDAQRAAQFMKGVQIRKTMEAVKVFLNKHEKLDDMSAKVTFDPSLISVEP